MITTLVLGAGTSKHYGYPTGGELLNRVKDILGKEKLGPEANIARSIDHIGIESLDAYMNLDQQSGPTLKRIIAEIIHSYENEDGFNVPIAESPYAMFMAAVHPENFKNFRIVSFNYDRSLEFYLARGIMALKRCNWAEAFNHLSALKIIHVHGRLSNLPGEKGYENIHAKTGELTYGYLNQIHERLDRARSSGQAPWAEAELMNPIIMHGQEKLKNCFENNVVCDAAQLAIEESDRICFMGFGFHATNMTTLGYPFTEVGVQKKKKVYGTTWKMPGNEFRRVSAHFPEIKIIPDCTAANLLRHQVSLSDPSLDVE